jgi:hypothetical protein
VSEDETSAVPGSSEATRIPLPAKISIWAVVVGVAVLLLWFVVFPWVEGLLPAEF